MEFEFKGLATAVLSAFLAYKKQDELIAKKTDFLKSIIAKDSSKPNTILFLGFDPWILGDYSETEIYVGLIDQYVARYLDRQGVQFTRVFDEELCGMLSFDVVVAADEFLTYVKSIEEQRQLVNLITNLTNEIFITTLRDYKNMQSSEKEFSQATAIKNDEAFSVFLEYHNYEYRIKDSWKSYIYENGTNAREYGPFHRVPMFFKQLANFGYGAGASGFTIHNDLMFKSVVRKNFEYIITMTFN